MNFLPSMLLATTIIGGSCNLPAGLSGLEAPDFFPTSCKENYVNCQVFVGTCSDLESIFDCFRPSFPGFGNCGIETETPDVEIPGDDAHVPDIKPEAPENGSSDAGQEAAKSFVEQVVSLVKFPTAMQVRISPGASVRRKLW